MNKLMSAAKKKLTGQGGSPKAKPANALSQPLVSSQTKPGRTDVEQGETSAKAKTPASPGIPTSPKISRANKTMSAVQLLQSQRADRSVKHMEDVKTTTGKRWVIIILTAVCSSTVSFAIDEFTQTFGNFRSWVSMSMPITVLIINVVAVVIAVLLARTQPKAQGSGFPEMKAILFGAKKNFFEILTPQVLGVKALVLSLVVGAGLPLGKEGPNVHMAACISNYLAPEYYQTGTWTANRKEKLEKKTKLLYLLLSCTAVGVGSSFSAPIAGVIFSIEIMLPQILDLVGFWSAFVSSVSGAFMYSLWRTAFSGGLVLEPLMSTDVQPNEGATSSRPVTRFLTDVLLGAICGLLSGYWVKLQAFLARKLKSMRDAKKKDAEGKTVPKNPNMDLIQVVVVTIVNTMLTVRLPLINTTQPALLSTLFSKQIMEQQEPWIWNSTGPLTTMCLCLLVKAFVTNISTCLPVATGVVAPVMIIGGLIGRCYGLLMPEWFYNFLLSTPGNEDAVTLDERHALMARFAIVGAAAFATGTCRAFAMAITVYEVLCLPNTLLPLCSACLAAGFVANLITHPFFDNNLIGRGWGGITKLTYASDTDQSACNLMREIVDDSYCLNELSSLNDIEKLLSKRYDDNLPDPAHFAIIRNLQKDQGAAIHTILVGSVSIEALRQIKANLEKARFPKGEDFSLLSAKYTVAGSENPHITLNPPNVHPQTIARDIYIIMKANDTDVVYVVDDSHHCCGIVEQSILLGHDF